MSLKGFNGTITAKSAYMNAHVSAAGGKSSVVLPVHIQSRSCEEQTMEGTSGNEAQKQLSQTFFLLSPIWINQTKSYFLAYYQSQGWQGLSEGHKLFFLLQRMLCMVSIYVHFLG